MEQSSHNICTVSIHYIDMFHFKSSRFYMRKFFIQVYYFLAKANPKRRVSDANSVKTNACMLKYILHGGDTDITDYIALYFYTMNAVATSFGTVMTVAFHSTSNQRSWSYMVCTNSRSSTSNSLVPAL